jgi:hypothetical protein
VRQQPDQLEFRVPVFSGTGLGHFGQARTDTARTVLFRDGVQVAESAEAGVVVHPGPAGPAAIRVETTATQSVFETSTEIRASWQFRTGAVGLLPVLAVRFRPELDLANSAPAGRAYLLPVSVERQAGGPDARVVSLTLHVSYDDGASWRPVPLIRTPHGWLAGLVHPDGGFVSVRARAVDSRGGSVEQTIIRAYRLRPAGEGPLSGIVGQSAARFAHFPG